MRLRGIKYNFQIFVFIIGRMELLLFQLRKVEYKVDICFEIDSSVIDDLEIFVIYLRGDDVKDVVEYVDEEFSWQICLVMVYWFF